MTLATIASVAAWVATQAPEREKGGTMTVGRTDQRSALTLEDSRWGKSVNLRDSPPVFPFSQGVADLDPNEPKTWTIAIQRAYTLRQDIWDFEIGWGSGGATLTETHRSAAAMNIVIHVVSAVPPTVRARRAFINTTPAEQDTPDVCTCVVMPGRPVRSLVQREFVGAVSNGIDAWAARAQVPVPFGAERVALFAFAYQGVIPSAGEQLISVRHGPQFSGLGFVQLASGVERSDNWYGVPQSLAFFPPAAVQTMREWVIVPTTAPDSGESMTGSIYFEVNR